MQSSSPSSTLFFPRDLIAGFCQLFVLYMNDVIVSCSWIDLMYAIFLMGLDYTIFYRNLSRVMGISWDLLELSLADLGKINCPSLWKNYFQ